MARAWLSSPFRTEPMMQPPSHFSVAPSRMLCAAIPWSQPKDWVMVLSPRMTTYADGLSPSSGPGQPLRYPAQARFGKITEFFRRSQDRTYFKGCLFDAEADDLARATRSLRGSVLPA